MRKVTVVIPNYNGIQYLDNCLAALFAQQSAEGLFHVIVVDNGSTDGSVSQAKERFPQVQWICLEENTGFCHAVNVGIQASTTPYVILLNNDTKVLDGFVEALLQPVENHPEIFSASAKMLQWNHPELIDDAGDRLCVFGFAYARGKGKRVEQFSKATKILAACGGAAIYRRDVFQEIGYFDELHFAYLEDIDVGYRASIYGYQNIFVPDAKVLHYGSAASGSRYNGFKARLSGTNNVYMVWKNMPFLQLLLNFPFLFVGFVIKFLFYCLKGMGILYGKGLWAGVKRCFSKEGRKQKVHFSAKHLGNYIKLQGQLYLNALRIIMKY